MSETITLTEDQFNAQFPLIKNHLDSNAAYDGHQFETYGAELDFIRAQSPNCIWTLMTDDNGLLCAGNGYHLVDRLGYLISTRPVPHGRDYFVPLEDPKTVADEYGLACPDCDGDDALQVVIATWANLSADGTEPTGDHEWDKTAACRCKYCDRTGTVADFTITANATSTG